MYLNLFKTNAVSALMQSLINKVVTPVVESVAKVKKNYPKMATTPEAEIGVYNQGVQTRQVKRAKARDEAKLMRG